MLGEKYFWCVVVVLLMVVSKLKYSANGDSQVPCYFIFGDSLADNGNNNLLNTHAKVNYSPYGIDFANGPTGRFCNGRTIVDIIAELLGFDNYIPPFATASGADILSGVNYASGAAGIRDETGLMLGDVITFNEQLQNHQILVSRLADALGGKESALRHLNKCLYSVGLGNNDYLNNYFLPQYYTTSQDYTPEKYADVLIEEFSQQLRILYESGARKVVLFGLGKIGCAPGVISTVGTTNGSACAEIVNDAVQLFNSRLISAVDQLNSDLTDAKFIYINNYKIGEDSTVLGFNVSTTGCCESSAIGQCIPDQIPCQNRSGYMFWDSYHPTETFNIFYAERSYSALKPDDAYPFDICHLVMLNQEDLAAK